MSTTYDLNSIAAAFVPKAAKYVAWRYRAFGVEREDVQQEMYAWLYSDEGISKVTRWLGNDPQQTTRIYRTLLDKGIQYGETEKAVRVGYEVDDITWYTPAMIEALMPLALDDEYVGGLDNQKAPGTQHGRKAPHETGDLLSMVVDVRKALDLTGLREFFLENDRTQDDDSENPLWVENARVLIDRLGGDRPYVGRRRAMSNAQAQAITRDQG